MTIDLGFDFVEPDSEYDKNRKHNLSVGDEGGIMIGNCYYTNEMIDEIAKKNKDANKKSSDSFFDPNDLV